MKKLLCYALAAALAVTTAVTGLVPMQADAASANVKQKVMQKLKPDKDKAEVYRKGEAIILTRGDYSTKVRRNSLAGELAQGSDTKVADTWKFNAPPRDSEAAAKFMKRQAVKQSGITIALVTSRSLSTEKLVKLLNQNDRVEIAEPNYICRASGVNSGKYFSKQWSLDNTGQNGGTKGQDIKVKEKWNKGITGSGDSVVAVIDTGVDYDHPDLRSSMWENPYGATLAGDHGFNFVNGSDDPMDDNGHGTHCAGIIGAAGTADAGVSGVNKNVKIMALKFLDEEGMGDLDGALAAYNYISKAVNKGINVVAVNNSWGGGEESEILAIAMDIVGDKGAVSVFAAGNEAMEMLPEKGLPTNAESQYNISVAATDEKGKLAQFSNYGRDYVDLAAPGTDILSTVSYDCFNPSIYDSAKRAELCTAFNDYEGAELWAGKDSITVTKLDGSKNPPNAENAAVSLDAGKYFGDKDGKSLGISVSGAEKGDVYAFEVPYTIPAVVKTLPQISAMVRTSGPEATDKLDFFGMEMPLVSYINIADVAENRIIKDQGDLEAVPYAVAGIDGDADYWSHLQPPCKAKVTGSEQKRKLVFVLECNYDGDYEMNFDNLGVSRADKKEAFGKYDFYNGTSMAAPYVTGAAALLKSEKKNLAGQDLIDEVLGAVATEPGLSDKVSTGGILNLGSDTSTASPRVRDALVDLNKNTITFQGSRLKDASLKLNGSAVAVSSSSEKELIIPAAGWINKLVDITVMNNGKSTTKRNVYLVKGKLPYTLVRTGGGYEDEDEDDEEGGAAGSMDALTTDGRILYAASSQSAAIFSYNPAEGREAELEPIAMAEAADIFKNPVSSWTDTQFTFSPDLVYLDGKLYNIASLSETADSLEDEEMGIVEATPYASEYKLICVDPAKRKIVSRGQLPKDLQNIAKWSAASYNGRLYVIGGYDYTSKSLSRKVKIYDPAKKKWYDGPSLPEGRAAGKVLQVGNKLVYTLGYAPGDKKAAACPRNLILEGGAWRTAKTQLRPYASKAVKISRKDYTLFQGSVGLCKGGLYYTGMPAEGLGDTFTYNAIGDYYQTTSYNHISRIGREGFIGTVAGSTMYGFSDDGKLYKAPASSGLVRVTASKMKNGKIKGSNKSWLPGTKVKLKAVPKSKKYCVKSFTVAGKKVKGSSKTLRLTQNVKAKAKFGWAVTKIGLNRKYVYLKAGKKFKLKVRVSPSKAAIKKVTYKSSNKKYATVNSKGVITVKKAGIGKTVRITVMAKDGSKKKAVCKVRILR